MDADALRMNRGIVVPLGVPSFQEMEQQSAQSAPGVEESLEQIRGLTLSMGEHVDEAIRKATLALIQRDVALANDVIRRDAELNVLQANTRRLCFLAMITQAPAARDLREVVGLQHMASELERMGDHCVNIARVARDLADLPPLRDYLDIPRLSERVAAQVRDMLSAVVARDVEQARSIAARDDVINRLYHRLVDELIALMGEHRDNVYRGTHLITACQNYERIGDRVTNLAEDLVFLESGDIEELG